jgi:hypothetical protein
MSCSPIALEMQLFIELLKYNVCYIENWLATDAIMQAMMSKRTSHNVLLVPAKCSDERLHCLIVLKRG